MTTTKQPWLDYRSVWRWHFYAGLFCIPFVVLLSITGAMYLFKPQVEAWLDRPYDHLVLTGQSASAAAQVRAALNWVSDSHLLAYELAPEDNAARVIVARADRDPIRVYVHPETLRILHTVHEEERFMRVVRNIHGELLIGNTGSVLVELAACWTIVMIITGLYLWWPRQIDGLAGIIYPRLLCGRRLFWRDLHAVTGLWISAFALFLLLTGLPWAKVWGEYFKQIRQVTGTAVAQQDWTTGRSATNESGDLEHVHHHHGDAAPPDNTVTVDYSALDAIVAAARPLRLASPVLVVPAGEQRWSVKSEAQNRTVRASLTFDNRGNLIKREDFAERHFLDRAVGFGVAAHEGQLFGWFNQLLGLLTALGLILLSISSVILWWRRRAQGVLGAPVLQEAPRFSGGLVVIVAALGIYLPMFGVSLLAILLIERTMLHRIVAVRNWLGLTAPNTV